MSKTPNGKNVLIIEDEVKLARFVELELRYEGYGVDVAHDGRGGLRLFREKAFDIVLLDLMLPGIDGMEIVKILRGGSDSSVRTDVPIIMLTAKGEITDKVTGLDSGADDYITKPFVIEELLARMRAALKKKHINDTEENGILTLNNLKIDTLRRYVEVSGETVELTKTEYELLVYLVQNKNNVITRDQILNEVWGYNYLGETNVVDVYIRYLRQKLDDRFNTKFIHTLRGVGYIAKD
ncbi:MAG: response regulator transcription factor [Clostridiales bacterium]|jgi:DNA-binding response OmpR family regulator|nr:response regulator transcription factor [Clostridiales bacterium]